MSHPKKALSFSIALILAMQVNSASGSIQQDMDDMFNQLGDMTNVTAPGVFESASRGVLSGGRIVNKSRQSTVQLLGMEIPGASAGCGGIDIYGGSFSFINSDQIVQFLRNVAANAKGLAFKIAIDAVSAQMGTVMTEFQKIAQQMNDTMMDSCSAAQGIINLTGIEGEAAKDKTQTDIKNSVKGFSTDFLSAWGNMEFGDKNSHEVIRENDPEEYKELTGNVLWKQMKLNNAENWFPYGDQELLETIMTIAGTVVVGDPPEDPNGKPEVSTIAGKPEILKALISGKVGEEIDILSCDGDTEHCNRALGKPKTLVLEKGGMSLRIEKMLLGGDGELGIVEKFRINESTSSFDEKDQAFVSNLPPGIGSGIRNLALLSPDAAVSLASKASDTIAIQMTYHLVYSYIVAAERALGNSKSPYAKSTLETITKSKYDLMDVYDSLLAQTTPFNELIEEYNNILVNVRKLQYITKK